MTCKPIQEKLEAYALDLLDAPERAQVSEHLSACAACRAILARHRQAALLLDRAYEETLPAHLVSKTLANLQHRPGAVKHGWWWGVPVLAGALAVVVMVRWGGINKLAVESPAAAKAARLLQSEAVLADVQPRLERKLPAANPVSDELNQELTNPIQDRSIYEELGVATDIAKLLL